jgi:CRP-like cAMP-binding protein
MPWLESVEALLASEVIHIPGAVFVHLLSRSVAMANALAVDLAKRVLIDSELSRQLAFGSAESVLASFLLDYAELFGVATDEGVRLEVRLNQQNLARSLSLSRKTVQRTIGQWIDGGVLMRRQGRFVLRKPEALQALSVRRQFGRAYSLQVKEQTP